MEILFQLVLAAMAVFIILLVLVQRGRGGGLAGALGGPGGSSAFGAKAGDVFTRITIITVSIWILTCLAASMWAANRGDAFGEDDAQLAGAVTEPEDSAISTPPANPGAEERSSDNPPAESSDAPADAPAE